MTKRNFAWLTINEDTDDDGFYLQGEAAYEAERRELKKAGAPDTDEIEFISILPEDRDSAMAEANVTEPFIAWAKSAYDKETWELTSKITEPVANGDSNLVYYEEGDEGKTDISYMK